MSEKLEIVNWPDSQYCMGCEHTSFVDGPKFDSSTYLCFKNRHPNDVMVDVGTEDNPDFQCSEREEEAHDLTNQTHTDACEFCTSRLEHLKEEPNCSSDCYCKE